MANIVVGVFDDMAKAEQARDELLHAGLNENQIRIAEREHPPQNQPNDEPAGFWDNIRDHFDIDEDAENAEARMPRGAVLSVIAQSDSLDMITRIIERHGPENIDQQRSTRTTALKNQTQKRPFSPLDRLLARDDDGPIAS